MREVKKEMLPPYLFTMMERFSSAEEEVYLVGGSLRDLLLGLFPHDYDLATSASPERTAALFADCRVIKTGIRHGTVTVLYENHPVEITTFRLDGSYGDSRHPDSVTFTKRVTEDLSRRDFTVNAMAYHPSVGVVDPFGGQEDLEKGLLRAVGDPFRRLSEDALRIMRAYRFSAQLGFSLEKNTERACRESKDQLTHIAKERISSEFLRLLSAKAPSYALRSMKADGILPYVTGQYQPREEVLTLMDQLPQEGAARLGFYFSDTDCDTVQKLTEAMRLSNALRVSACAVVRGCKRSVQGPADARRLIALCGTHALDAAAASVLLGNSPIDAVEWVRSQRAPCTRAELAISGRDLQELDFRGRELGRALERLMEQVLEEPSLNQRDTLLAIAKGIKSGEKS